MINEYNDLKTKFNVVFDLQLFADTVVPGNIATNMHTTSSANISPEFQKAQDEDFLRQVKAKLTMVTYARKKNVGKRKGKTIQHFKVDRTSPSNTRRLTEGYTPDPSKLTITDVTGSIAQYGDYHVFTDEVMDTSMHDLISVSKRAQARQAAEAQDKFTRDLLVSGASQVLYCPPVTNGVAGTAPSALTGMTTNCRLTVAVVVKAVAMLKADDIPPAVGDNYVMLIHPHVWHDLILDPEWQKFHVNSPANMEDGELGRIAGCIFVDTSRAKITVDGGADSNLPVYHNIILGSEAYEVLDLSGEGVKFLVKLPSTTNDTSDPLGQRATVGHKFWWGGMILDELALIDVRSCSTEFAGVAEAN